ncbi:short-chain dehydrogenase [Asaia sp. W19]|uniref:SDR family oxidoreductase n=1 Tax=unclassified Asaia TaxID=2685023 RepID=UPI000F8D8A4B|nr:SDR family oxidoreductase [Asaia sp. W19]RUT25718.1 short-chain dehydrogenase [Asaia sp. W19]
MMHKKVALVTGANKGIGFEIAKALASRGISVYIGARSAERGYRAAADLSESGLDARFVQLDVTDDKMIAAAAEKIEAEHGVLDILVNNAGLIDQADGPPSQVGLEVLRRTFETNFFGAVSVSRALLPLLRRSPAGRVVNVSSGLGSLALNEDPEWPFVDTKLLAYNASKAALNMLTVQMAWELRNTGIKVNASNPNFTDTDLVPGLEGGRPAVDGARTSIDLALLAAEGPTGGFFEDGKRLPW